MRGYGWLPEDESDCMMPNTTWFTYYWKHHRIKSRENLLRTVKEKTNSSNIQGSNNVHMILREYCANTHIIMYNQQNLILINIIICWHRLSAFSNYLAAGRNQGLRIVFRFNHLVSATFVHRITMEAKVDSDELIMLCISGDFFHFSSFCVVASNKIWGTITWAALDEYSRPLTDNSVLKSKPGHFLLSFH